MRCGDHLPPHKYIRNTSTCGTTLTEHLLSTGRRPQTSQKARNSPRTWVGQKKKENTEAKKRDGTAPEPPRRAQAAAINADTRDRHEMLRLLLLPPRRLYASIGHYPHLPSWEPVQPATARVRDPGTTSLGEHTVHLRLVQCHAGLCCYRFALHPYPSLPPA